MPDQPRTLTLTAAECRLIRLHLQAALSVARTNAADAHTPKVERAVCEAKAQALTKLLEQLQ